VLYHPASHSLQIALFVELQAEAKPCPAVHVKQALEEDDLTGQKDALLQFARTAGLAQSDPGGQSFSTVDRSGQCEPNTHSVLVAVSGQKNPAAQPTGSLDPSAQ
jgi:hypothetical protein